MKQKYSRLDIKSTNKASATIETLLLIANELAILNNQKCKIKTAKLTEKEDEFWEEVYNQLVNWKIHEDLTYELCFVITKAKFRRLGDVDKFI